MTKEEALNAISHLEYSSPHESTEQVVVRKYYADLLRAYVENAEPAQCDEWLVLEGKLDGYATLNCKKCGTTFDYVPSWKYHYCPNCGIQKMKKGEKNAHMTGKENQNGQLGKRNT